MSEHLQLDRVRDALARLEETILFALIERAQFRRNDPVYRPGALGGELGGLSLLGYLLHETEALHARLRRYTSPDEHPFTAGLPEPILALRDISSPLTSNRINLNGRLLDAYIGPVRSALCAEGDDGEYGSSAVADVNCLQALSKRVHYGKFVAESKYQQDAARFADAMRVGDRARLLAAVTDGAVEEAVLSRVGHKARAYAGELGPRAGRGVDVAALTDVYRRWIIPLNKEVQVEYLLARGG